MFVVTGSDLLGLWLARYNGLSHFGTQQSTVYRFINRKEMITRVRSHETIWAIPRTTAVCVDSAPRCSQAKCVKNCTC